MLWKEEVSFTEKVPFGACVEQEAELQSRQVLSVSARNNRTFQRSLLQGQGAFCYVNEPNSFVLVAVFKCQVVDTSVVLNTSNRGAEHQPRASRVLLQTRGVCLGLHFKQQLLDARNGAEEPQQQERGSLAGQGH